MVSELEQFLRRLMDKINGLDDRAKNYILERLDINLVTMAFNVELCESPIEQLFNVVINKELDDFLLRLYLCNKDWAKLANEFMEKEQDPYPIYIKPQEEIVTDNGKYRVDFLISVVIPPYEQKKIKHIVVECDGHEFHEKTKEQAQRDKSRDRDLQSHGYTVLRFTGSEIWRDPNKCVREVFRLIEKMISER